MNKPETECNARILHSLSLRACLNFPIKLYYQVSFEFVSGLFSRFYCFPDFMRQIARYPPYKIRRTSSKTILKINLSKM